MQPGESTKEKRRMRSTGKKDRELASARQEERERLEVELKKKHEQKINSEIYINEMERQRNRDHMNKRADLYCEHPEKEELQ